MALGYSSEFVNREKQWLGFLKMINGETLKQIMIIKAPEQMGKTWLIQRMEHEATRRAIPLSLWDFTRGYQWNYLTLVRLARDRIGTAYFNHMTEVINNSTSLGHSSMPFTYPQERIDRLKYEDSPRDNFGDVQADSDIVRRNLEMQITDAFLQCLDALSKGQRVLFLLDTVERAPEGSMNWIIHNLLEQIRYGRLPNVLVVIAGRQTPELDGSWDHWVGRTGLDMFSVEHIEELLDKRRSIQELIPDIGSMPDMDDPQRLKLYTKGHPGHLGLILSNLFIDQLQEEPEEDWM